MKIKILKRKGVLKMNDYLAAYFYLKGAIKCRIDLGIETTNKDILELFEKAEKEFINQKESEATNE